MKNYKGKYFSVYGDSLSTLFGFVPSQNEVYYWGEESEISGVELYEDTWWGIVIEKLGGRFLKNNSWSGCLVTDPYGYNVQSCGCYEERLNSLGDGEIKPDVIMVFMGSNDRGHNLKVFCDEPYSIKCFYGAYSYILKRLKSLYPCAEIWCMTFRCQEIFKKNGDNSCTDSHSQAVRDCAEKFGCKLIDLFNYPPYEVYDINNIHANKHGMKDISNAVLAEVERF